MNLCSYPKYHLFYISKTLILFRGRFLGVVSIDIWPRPLMWAFEWPNTDKPIRLKRSQPLFYCQFELDNPERSFQVVEAERTPELENYLL